MQVPADDDVAALMPRDVDVIAFIEPKRHRPTRSMAARP